MGRFPAEHGNPLSTDKPFVAEYYYKAKWGYADEFIALFKKNHYPAAEETNGTWQNPESHRGGAALSCYRRRTLGLQVTIVFKNAATANDDFDNTPLLKQLFPDQTTYKREEQRRFEILEAHWDLPIKDVDLDKP